MTATTPKDYPVGKKVTLHRFGYGEGGVKHDPKKDGDSGTVEEWVNHDRYIKVRMSNGNLLTINDKGGSYRETGGQIRSFFEGDQKGEASSPPAKKAKTDGTSDAKKGGGGFKGMACPFSKSEFMSSAKETTMELELTPKQFGPGGYGWQKGGGIAKVVVDNVTVYVRPSCIANVLGSKDGGKELKLPTGTFLKKAATLKVTFEICPCEFSTGSFGWMAHRKQNENVDGKSLSLQINFNAPINASKEKGDDEDDPVVATISTSVISKHFPVIGTATAKEKDDLTKIRGIGPWIESRLNKIEIFTFSQIAKMTPEIEDAVNDAIKYFPGRVRRDEWVLQARALAGGRWADLNPITSKTTGSIKLDGVDYEKKLIEIADHAMSDGLIEHFEAEALWLSASDGNKITPLEKKTLRYIMSSDKYKVDEDAEEYLESKLSALDARGVIKH